MHSNLRGRPGASFAAQTTVRASMSPVSAFVVLDVEPGAFAVGSWKNVLIVVWRTQATAPLVDRLDRAILTLAGRQPGLRSNVHVISEGAGLPTPEARAGFVTLMRRNAHELACISIVIDGSGFWSGALRAALTGIRLVTPRSIQYRLVGSVDDTVRGLPVEHEERTGVRLDAGQLRTAIGAAQRAAAAR
jgi:hypothetical protein